MAEIFGFEIKRKEQEKEDAKMKSFVAPLEDDGSSYIQAGGGGAMMVSATAGAPRSGLEAATRIRR